MTGNSAGHAEPGVCVYVRRPNEALHQLVGDIIILRQQLAGNIEGHTVRPVTGNSVGKALGHLTDRPVPAYAPPPDFRIEYASFEPYRFAQIRSLGAPSDACGGRFSVSFSDGGGLC